MDGLVALHKAVVGGTGGIGATDNVVKYLGRVGYVGNIDGGNVGHGALFPFALGICLACLHHLRIVLGTAQRHEHGIDVVTLRMAHQFVVVAEVVARLVGPYAAGHHVEANLGGREAEPVAERLAVGVVAVEQAHALVAYGLHDGEQHHALRDVALGEEEGIGLAGLAAL